MRGRGSRCGWGRASTCIPWWINRISRASRDRVGVCDLVQDPGGFHRGPSPAELAGSLEAPLAKLLAEDPSD
jgi:hypothetical protein